ncbi:MAG: hypothetical protein ABI068_11980 [Ktedonobacterales bacterium]
MAKKHDSTHDEQHTHPKGALTQRARQPQTAQPYLNLPPANLPTWKGSVAIVGARLIDGSGADPLDDATLIFAGERIVAVGRSGAITVPAGATVIEAHGKTLMPGLIDCHVHFRGQWGYDLLRDLLTPPSLSTL